jgi:hypothetical protein
MRNRQDAGLGFEVRIELAVRQLDLLPRLEGWHTQVGTRGASKAKKSYEKQCLSLKEVLWLHIGTMQIRIQRFRSMRIRIQFNAPD